MIHDRRSKLANERVAHLSLEGQVEAPRFAEVTPRTVMQPLANLLDRPGGQRDSQLLFGETFEVLDVVDDYAFGRAARDGYVGYVAASALGPAEEMTHWVAAPATHLYPKGHTKVPPEVSVFFGSRVRVTAEREAFLRIHTGHFIPRSHLQPLRVRYDEPVAVADTLLGSPYVWGGVSRWGIDCSGLVQTALVACGVPCPRDTDQQHAVLGRPLPPHGTLQRGDLVFWEGHVGWMSDARTLLHANQYHMAVAYEPVAEAVERIAEAGFGPVTATRRLR